MGFIAVDTGDPVRSPSPTGDVEQILTLGVHGPRPVHIVLVTPP